MQRRRARKRKPTLKEMLESLLSSLFRDGVEVPLDDWARIASSRHLTADEFATEVLIAEATPYWHRPQRSYWYVRIRQRFRDQFGDAVSAEDPRVSPPED
jgi:hypothetical protein